MGNDRRLKTLPLPWWLILGQMGGALLLGSGFLSVWIPHEVAGLAILGVDFLTYVKLLPGMELTSAVKSPLVWSLPLVTSSLVVSQGAWCCALPAGRLRVWALMLRLIAWSAALYFALQILPLDWLPSNLLWRSNLMQTAGTALCVALAFTAPVSGSFLMAHGHFWIPWLSLGTVTTAVWLRNPYLPWFSELYRQTLDMGYGPPVMLAGAVTLIALQIGLFLFRWNEKRQ